MQLTHWTTSIHSSKRFKYNCLFLLLKRHVYNSHNIWAVSTVFYLFITAASGYLSLISAFYFRRKIYSHIENIICMYFMQMDDEVCVCTRCSYVQDLSTQQKFLSLHVHDFKWNGISRALHTIVRARTRIRWIWRACVCAPSVREQLPLYDAFNRYLLIKSVIMIKVLVGTTYPIMDTDIKWKYKQNKLFARTVLFTQKKIVVSHADFILN